MAGKKQQAEDPWSGFVDVLSNVVMVVTFLVIILGISMFALSQQVAKSMAAEMMKSEESQKEIQDQISRETIAKAEKASAAAQAAALDSLRESMGQQIAEAQEARKQAEARVAAMGAELAALRKSAEKIGSEGVNRFTVDRPLLQNDEIEGSSNLTVRSRRLKEDFETIVASAEEEAKNDGTTRVEKSDAMLKVAYERSMFKIDAETTDKIRAFMKESADARTGTIELRTFANSTIGSVSEARRIAYYRAMTVRGVAVAAGFEPSRIKIVLRESERDTDANTVWIFAKPQ